MKLKFTFALLAVALFVATSAFADTYQYTVNYNADGPVPAGGEIQFTSNSLQPSVSGLNNVTVLNAPAGFFLAQFLTNPSNCCTPNEVSVVWDLSANGGQTFDNIILYNNAYGDWAIGTYGIVGNSNASNYPNARGTISVVDLTTSETPEPGSLALLGSGLIGLAGALRRKILG